MSCHCMKIYGVVLSIFELAKQMVWDSEVWFVNLVELYYMNAKANAVVNVYFV